MIFSDIFNQNGEKGFRKALTLFFKTKNSSLNLLFTFHKVMAMVMEYFTQVMVL